MKFLVQGPSWPPLSPGDGRDRLTGIQNTSIQCVWMGRIHIMHLGPLTDLYCTPGPPKGPILAPKGPFGGPRGSWRAPGGRIWSKLPPIGPTGLELWLPHTLPQYWVSPGPQGGPKRAHFGPERPFWGSLRDSEVPRGSDLAPTTANWSD